jgi:hypothetical protein
LLGEATVAAKSDPLFGLPAWVRERDLDDLRPRPLVILGVNEFTYGLAACLEPGRADCARRRPSGGDVGRRHSLHQQR